MATPAPPVNRRSVAGGPRLVSASDAVERVRSGQRVFVDGAAAMPDALLRALVERANEVRDVDVVHLHANGRATR
jgi:acyl-CoA hydrolase